MGLYTWTLADKGNKEKLLYGEKGYLSCPDGTFLCAYGYEGYGKFSGLDVFELLAEWNKDDLVTILKKEKVSSKVIKIVTRYQKRGECAAQKVVDKMLKDGEISDDFAGEWLRNIGLVINDLEFGEEPLKYPIKVTSDTKIPYEELPASYNVQ